MIGAVRAYQLVLRPVIGANCRFHPHCSAYAIEAIKVHGALRGGALAGWRVLRCNPWSEGGYDPVPPARQDGGHMPSQVGGHMPSHDAGCDCSLKGCKAR
jgi:putative membrane protein insertion efficiency factor